MKNTVIKISCGLLILLSIAIGLLYQKHHSGSCVCLPADTVSNSATCALDSNEAYLILWEKVFLNRAQIHEEYYRNHITVITGVSVL